MLLYVSVYYIFMCVHIIISKYLYMYVCVRVDVYKPIVSVHVKLYLCICTYAFLQGYMYV